MNLGHIESLTDDVGIFEHCLGDRPRTEHGYCVDDVARALIVVERTGRTDAAAQRLADVYSTFLTGSQTDDGRVINRRAVSGVWCGAPSTEDHWGRALWAWGTSMRWARSDLRAEESLRRFEGSARQRSPFLRSMMFAALGAIEVLEAVPGHRASESLLRDALDMIPAGGRPRWPWPEPRLTYANAVIPEVMMLGGSILNDGALVRRGKELLAWLVEVQTNAGRFSIIPHTGWTFGEPLPAFDQQPIEVAALVDACSAAFDLTSDHQWRDYAVLGRRWFDGHNDQGIPMRDTATGAGFDALTGDGRNANQGAESTLAQLSVYQRTERFLQAAA
jgi:hypothetical protein